MFSELLPGLPPWKHTTVDSTSRKTSSTVPTYKDSSLMHARRVSRRKLKANSNSNQFLSFPSSNMSIWMGNCFRRWSFSDLASFITIHCEQLNKLCIMIDQNSWQICFLFQESWEKQRQRLFLNFNLNASNHVHVHELAKRLRYQLC